MATGKLSSYLPKDFPSNCSIEVIDDGKLSSEYYRKKIQEIVKDYISCGHGADSVDVSMEIFMQTGILVSVLFKINANNHIEVII